MSAADEQRHTKAGLREVLEDIAAYHQAARSTVDPELRQRIAAHLDKLHQRREFLQSQLGQRPRVEPRRDRRGGHTKDRAWK